jgi:D-alanine--(R)-lactate ligase
MARTRIGIIFGGASEEHPISLKSAREVARHLDRERYEPHWIGITEDGEWKLCDGPEPGWETARHAALLSPDRNTHGIISLDGDHVDVIQLDVVLPILHGTMGEDGAIQGLLELSGIPYVGCGIQSSAVCMDKSLAYTVVASAGIATPDYTIVMPNGEIKQEPTTYPVFVKPARSGSSFGVTKVTQASEMTDALEAARQYDSKVLIENAVDGIEIGCAILGNGPDLIAGEVDRVALSHGFFRIHQEESPETGSENSTFIVPADISDESRRLVRETAKTIYRVLGCSGLARVDLFLTRDGHVILNEVNTLPGLTSYSRYPRMMAAAGMPLSDVIDRLVAMALEKEMR